MIEIKKFKKTVVNQVDFYLPLWIGAIDFYSENSKPRTPPVRALKLIVTVLGALVSNKHFVAEERIIETCLFLEIKNVFTVAFRDGEDNFHYYNTEYDC